MQIIVNGDDKDIDQNATIASLLGELGLQDQPCAVEVNRQLVPRAEHASTTLCDGDRVELVTLVGGG